VTPVCIQRGSIFVNQVENLLCAHVIEDVMYKILASFNESRGTFYVSRTLLILVTFAVLPVARQHGAEMPIFSGRMVDLGTDVHVNF